jgi:hypothetical protein
MVDQSIHFNDGDVYQRTMGVWSQLAGEQFLDWLALPSGLRWIDIGCGNGAFTDCSSSDVPQQRLLGSIPLKLSSLSRGTGPQRKGLISSRVTHWHSHSRATDLMPRLWRW